LSAPVDQRRKREEQAAAGRRPDSRRVTEVASVPKFRGVGGAPTALSWARDRDQKARGGEPVSDIVHSPRWGLPGFRQRGCGGLIAAGRAARPSGERYSHDDPENPADLRLVSAHHVRRASTTREASCSAEVNREDLGGRGGARARPRPGTPLVLLGSRLAGQHRHHLRDGSGRGPAAVRERRSAGRSPLGSRKGPTAHGAFARAVDGREVAVLATTRWGGAGEPIRGEKIVERYKGRPRRQSQPSPSGRVLAWGGAGCPWPRDSTAPRPSRRTGGVALGTADRCAAGRSRNR